MARKPYRVEITYPNRRKPQYFLVKEVRAGNKHSKIKKYMGSGDTPPSASDVKQYCEKYAYDLEMRVALKKAELSSASYSSDYLTRDQIGYLEEIRYIYKSFRDLLTTNELESYEKNFEIKYIQGTTFIEGNTLSLTEASDLILRGIQPKDKTLREMNEVQNFKRVVAYRNKYRGKITLDFIKRLHALIMYNIDDDSAGCFRRSDDIGIEGRSSLKVALAEEIDDLLDQGIEHYYIQLEKNSHPFEEAVMFHHKFELIHPFTNGNGRVGREIFNYMLTREKYPRLLFLGDNRETYLGALRFGDQGNYADMVSTFAEIIREQRYKILTKYLEKVVQPIKKKGQMRLVDF